LWWQDLRDVDESFSHAGIGSLNSQLFSRLCSFCQCIQQKGQIIIYINAKYKKKNRKVIQLTTCSSLIILFPSTSSMSSRALVAFDSVAFDSVESDSWISGNFLFFDTEDLVSIIPVLTVPVLPLTVPIPVNVG